MKFMKSFCHALHRQSMQSWSLLLCHGRFLFHFCAESEFYPGLHALDRRDSHIQYMTYMALLGTEVGLRDGTQGGGDCRGGQTTVWPARLWILSGR